MRAAEQRQAHGVGVFLQRGLGNLLGGLVQTGVDHLEPVVAQCPGDGLRPAIVTIETGFGDDDAIGALHEPRTIRPHRRLAPIAIGGTLWSCDDHSCVPHWLGQWCPCSGGIGFFALVALVLWGIASLVAQNGSSATANLASNVFRPGSVVRYAAIIDEDGPVLFPDLLGTDGDKTIVLDHDGSQSDERLEHLPRPSRPIGRSRCKVTQVQHTDQFTDCEGTNDRVEELARPAQGMQPVVSADGILTLDLTPD